jgi:hypothetical protein
VDLKTKRLSEINSFVQSSTIEIPAVLNKILYRRRHVIEQVHPEYKDDNQLDGKMRKERR